MSDRGRLSEIYWGYCHLENLFLSLYLTKHNMTILKQPFSNTNFNKNL